MLTSQTLPPRTITKREKHVTQEVELSPLQAKRKKKSTFFESNRNLPFTLAIWMKGLTKAEEQVRQELVEAIAALEGIYVLNVEANKESSTWQEALAVADAALIFPSQQRNSVQSFLIPLKEGVVPVVATKEETRGILIPFDPVEEKGNSFFYAKSDVWNIFAAIVKAQENYKFPYDWENLIQACVESAR